MFSTWPGVFVAEGQEFKLDFFASAALGVVVWIRDVTVVVPGGPSLRLVMLEKNFDQEIAVRVIAKRLKQAATDRYGVNKRDPLDRSRKHSERLKTRRNS